MFSVLGIGVWLRHDCLVEESSMLDTRQIHITVCCLFGMCIHVCMYICVYVWMTGMSVCMSACMHTWMHERLDGGWKDALMSASRHECMHVCMLCFCTYGTCKRAYFCVSSKQASKQASRQAGKEASRQASMHACITKESINARANLSRPSVCTG